MRIDRAAKFGVIAAMGLTAISAGTYWLIQSVRFNVIRPEDSLISMLIVLIGGTAASLMFLFAVIGVFVDRKLAARGVPDPEE